MKHVFFALLIVKLIFALPIPAQAQPAPPSIPSETEAHSSVEERRLLDSLQSPNRGPLAQERAALEKRTMELKVLEEEVDKKIEQLNQLRQQIEDLLAEKDAEELNRIEELARMYERMNADKAAQILASIDEQLAVAILGVMRTKAAAGILNNMDREKAASLTSTFSTLDIR
jgi:flagellar motility protein MotE (MotC chaperone)